MKKIGEVSLYPMFDNEAGLGFDCRESDYIGDKECAKKLFNYCTYLRMKHIVPGEIHGSYSYIQDIVEYLLKKYPVQSLIAYKKVNSFSYTDLADYLEEFPELSKSRKELTKKFFVAHDIIYNRSVQKIVKEQNMENLVYKYDI